MVRVVGGVGDAALRLHVGHQLSVPADLTQTHAQSRPEPKQKRTLLTRVQTTSKFDVTLQHTDVGRKVERNQSQNMVTALVCTLLTRKQCERHRNKDILYRSDNSSLVHTQFSLETKQSTFCTSTETNHSETCSPNKSFFTSKAPVKCRTFR